jgi:hypothetical protein
MILKGEPPTNTDHPVNESLALGKALDVALSKLPGESTTLGLARWARSGYCERPVDGWKEYAIDVEYVCWAEAEVGVDEWRRWSGPEPCAAFLIGLRDGEPVAVLAGRRVDQ